MYNKPPIPMPKDITIGEKYHYAMTIRDPEEARAYLEACIDHTVTYWGRTHEEAEQIERSNLGYFAGYYDFETRQHVERLFGGVHPVFGPVSNGQPTVDEAIHAGWRMATKGS